MLCFWLLIGVIVLNDRFLYISSRNGFYNDIAYTCDVY